jgi:uncharacterized protein (TIGR00255 family)
MTGFGRAQGRLSDRFGATMVVRSVNHRGLDIQVRTNLREEAPQLEALVRTEISGRYRRGRVTAQLNLERSGSGSAQVTVNTDAVASLLDQLSNLDLPEGIARSVELRDVLGVPGLVSVSSQETLLEETETEALRIVVAEAVEAAAVMRVAEGERLLLQVKSELEQVTSFVDWFEPQMPDLRRRIMDRSKERISALVESEVSADPDRLVQEAAVIADRADVAEEVVRLRAHLATFSERLLAGGAIGRTLDFVCQEIHRELNTLGSKCREVGVVDRLIEAKAACERVREQIQNLE